MFVELAMPAESLCLESLTPFSLQEQANVYRQ